jgi:PIN domain nuclease of toxin-antitoxin system
MSGRIPRILIDTLPWLQFVLGDTKLSAASCKTIDASAKHGKLFLSAASICEITLMVKKGTLLLTQPQEKWFEDALLNTKTQIFSIDAFIAFEMEQLPKEPRNLDFIEKAILATARHGNITLLTTRPCFLDYAKTGFIKIR